MATQENFDKKLLEIYKNEILDFSKNFSQNDWKNIFNQKIEIWYNPEKKYFLILDWTHRFKGFLELFWEWKIWLKFLWKFKIEFSESLISCEKKISEISADWNFSEEILKDEKISEVVKKIYLNE